MKHFLTLALSLFISSAAHAYHSETTNNTLYPVCMTVYEWASGETMGKIEDDLHKKNFKGRCRGATLIQPGNSMQAGSGCENFHIVEYRAFFPLVAKNSDLKCDEQAAADKTLITKHIYQAKNADGITRQNLASITHYEAFVDEHYLQGLENHCLSNGEVKKIGFKMAELDSKNKFVKGGEAITYHYYVGPEKGICGSVAKRKGWLTGENNYNSFIAAFAHHKNFKTREVNHKLQAYTEYKGKTVYTVDLVK